MIKVTRPQDLIGSDEKNFHEAIKRFEEYLGKAQAGLSPYVIWLPLGTYSEAVQRRIEETYKQAGWIGVQCAQEDGAIVLTLREPDKSHVTGGKYSVSL